MKPFFYQLTPEQATQELKTDPHTGLTHAEAKSRLEQYGRNELKEVRRRPIWFRFFDQFKDLMIVVLIVAALLAYYLDDFRGGTILLVIVFVNACIGFFQEYKAERILQSLKKMVRRQAFVIREGQRMEIDSAELVPGDIVYLEEGAGVPADIRLIETSYFSTNDFILTGESVPQEKRAELVFDRIVTVTNQDNSVFLGTTVANGHALGLVYGTGMDTAIGRIAKTTSEIKDAASPLQQELNTLAKTLTKVAGAIALGLFFINFLLHINSEQRVGTILQLSILFAIGVAAACVPQGLPAQVSVALSLGVGRMAKKNAIVKKLSAVETLGCTTIICSDKTGTITKNEMTILDCVLPSHSFKVTGEGYSPQGFILNSNGNKIDSNEFMAVKQFFLDGFLASNGKVKSPDKDHDEWYAVGDPTEAAFSTLAMKAGFDLDGLEKNFQRVTELPFDSVRKRMTIIREHKGKTIAYLKGGIESVLAACSRVNESGGETSAIADLTAEKRAAILSSAESYSRASLRVIALAYRDFPHEEKEFSIERTEKDFVFAGFVTMMDPPRSGVSKAVKAAYEANIKVIMITGDNALTAMAIAEKIGMNNGGGKLKIFTGDQIKTMKDAEIRKLTKDFSVIFARVSPEDKYRLVRIFTEMGQVVAVTGDGVNDTLSLKQADIGVAMGKMGSEVAKEASEIILLDDNFATLVTAIREGRTIFQNLKKTILSTITSNNGELFCVLLGFIGVALGFPAPLTAVQILAVDLIGEMLPLTALTFDTADEAIMRSRPRDLKSHIINRRSMASLFFYGFWMGAAGYLSFVMIYKTGASLASAQAGAYVSIMLCQWINILSRRYKKTLFTRYSLTNIQLWISYALSAIFVAILLYVPFVSVWFGFGPLSLKQWAYPIAGAIVFLAWHELRKALIHRGSRIE